MGGANTRGCFSGTLSKTERSSILCFDSNSSERFCYQGRRRGSFTKTIHLHDKGTMACCIVAADTAREDPVQWGA